MNAEPIMSPIHPGEVLMHDYLQPLEVTQHRLAVAIGVPPRRINDIVHGKRRITVDTALRLARYFATTERFWLNLQDRYDLEVERDRLAPALKEIRPLAQALSTVRRTSRSSQDLGCSARNTSEIPWSGSAANVVRAAARDVGMDSHRRAHLTRLPDAAPARSVYADDNTRGQSSENSCPARD
ncbi:MAG: HigA family addiction module antidote protein [Solirubrobacterales bacterium]|nr:HigA family addiction module antidote protein [Solirubrobacterales bacterium]